jgi:hypothetical protein
MKKFILFGVILLNLLSIEVYGQKENERVKVNPAEVSSDSIEYELLVFDPGFEFWYLTKPIEQHLHQYYRLKNIQYVSEWNNQFLSSGKYSQLLMNRIEYDQSVNYPAELDTKLYWYFIYFEETNNIKLLPYSR